MILQIFTQARAFLRAAALMTLAVSAASHATTYYVSTSGVDSDGRSGTSQGASWKSLAYACGRVPEGNHEIRLGSGTFTETVTAVPKSGVSIIGNGSSGSQATIVRSSESWSLGDIPFDFLQYRYTNYIIAVDTWRMGLPAKVHDVTISGIRFESSPTRLLDGALYFRDCERITIHDVTVENFRWAGMFLAFCSALDVYNCSLTNANVEEHGHWSGNIQTHWIENSTFHEITSANTIRGNWGVGYKGGGHQGVKIYNSSFTGEGFSMEIMFENEYGVEIYGCTFSSPLSIPKEMGDNPNTRGYPYTFWIHDNYMTSSYTVEGPRNHLRFDHNFIQISTNTNGRCYSQFGGNTQGPLWFHHNIVENVDRAFIWKGSGRLDSVYVYNNTVYCADAADRSAAILDSWGNMAGWHVKNNIFVCPPSRRRELGDVARLDASHNVCVNVDNVPAGNFDGQDPQLRFSGSKPYPYYAPANSASFVVDKGIDVGLPFEGLAPDIGAYEYGATTWLDRPARATSGQTLATRVRFDRESKRLYVLTTTTAAAGQLNVRLLDAGGRVIAVAAVPSSGTGAIDLSGLAAGGYVAEVRCADSRIGTHAITVR